MRTPVSVSFVLLALVADKAAVAFSPTKHQQRITSVGTLHQRHYYPLHLQRGWLVNGHISSRRVATRLRNDNQQDDNVEQEEAGDLESPAPLPPLPKLNASVLLPWLSFVLFWPLLALLRVKLDGIGNPVEYFDIDKYTALKSMMQEPPDFDEILELPPLSPAEQLVGTFFGPPR